MNSVAMEKNIPLYWISTSEEKVNEPNTWIAFRKDIVLDKVPRQAIASIAADTKYWLWINGEPVVFEGGSSEGPIRMTPIMTKSTFPHTSKKVRIKLPFCSGTSEKTASRMSTAVAPDFFSIWISEKPQFPAIKTGYAVFIRHTAQPANPFPTTACPNRIFVLMHRKIFPNGKPHL